MMKSNKIELDGEFMKVLNEEPRAFGKVDPVKEALFHALQEDHELSMYEILLKFKRRNGSQHV